MANGHNRSRTVTIEVCVLFNFPIIFDFNLFPAPPNKAQFIGNVLLNRQNAAISSRGPISATSSGLLVH
jgi:hypothetical protein